MRVYFLYCSGIVFVFFCCQSAASLCFTYHLYHLLPYALTLDRVSLAHVQMALFTSYERFVIHPCYFTVSAYRLLHTIAIISNSSLVTASSSPPVRWHPIQYVSLFSAPLKSQVLHRFVHWFPETRLYLPTSEEQGSCVKFHISHFT